jgi:hypothetical protein
MEKSAVFDTDCVVCGKTGELVFNYPVPDGKGGLMREVMVTCGKDKNLGINHMKGMGLIEGVGYTINSLREVAPGQRK